jgi:DNA-binding HxlR family transcriptional regulator
VLLSGPKRTCELEQHIPSLTQMVLIQQLCADYALTPLGMSLEPLIMQLRQWGEHRAEELDDTGRWLPCNAAVRPTIRTSKR